MSKTTWTAQNRSQLVAALVRKGFDRAEVRDAMHRAYENGFAWAYSLENRKADGDAALCNALITFGDTEVDMWDASLHTDGEIGCDCCQTRAHNPARLTQVEGIGNVCNRCMNDVRTFSATVERWNGLVAADKVDAAYIAECVARVRNLAAHLGIELPDTDGEPAQVPASMTVDQHRATLGASLAARYIPADMPGDIVVPVALDAMTDAIKAWRAVQPAKVARTFGNPHTTSDGVRVGTLEVTAIVPGDVLRDGAEILGIKPAVMWNAAQASNYLTLSVRKGTKVTDVTAMRSNRYLVRIPSDEITVSLADTLASLLADVEAQQGNAAPYGATWYALARVKGELRDAIKHAANGD